MRLRALTLLFFLLLFFHVFPTAVRAVPEVSEPTKAVYLTDFFNLYRFLPPQEILLYENRDMARKDIKQEIVSDTRPKQGSDCTLEAPDQCKGIVVLHNEVSPGNFEVQTLPDQGVCRPQDSERVVGYCDYRKKPANEVDVTSIDYSKTGELPFCKLQNRFCSYWHNGGGNTIGWGSDNLSVSASDQYIRRAITLAQAEQTRETYNSTKEFPLGGVKWDAPLDPATPGLTQTTVSSTGPKCKTVVDTLISAGETVIGAVNGNGQDSVWKCGTDGSWQEIDAASPVTFKPASYTGAPAVCRREDNIYKYGDIVDGKEQCNTAGKLVPLATTPGTSDATIFDAWKELGSDGDSLAVKGSARILLGYWQDIIKPPPVGEKEEPTPGVSNAIKSLNEIIGRNLAKPVSQRPLWLQYFMRAPECGPGYDKGYVLASVCMLGNCTPVSSNEEFVNSNPSFRSQTIYSDSRIRQNLCAAVYNVYQQHSLSEARTIIRKARHLNPLFDCTLRADEACTPTFLSERLSSSLDTATYPLAKNKFFSLPWFHKILDGWRTPDGGFWLAKLDFKLKNGGEYRGANAFEEVGVLGVLVNGARAVGDWIDSVFQALHHTVVVPPLAAHSIDAIERATVLIRQTAAQNAIDDAATIDYSNAVAAGSTNLNAGNGTAPRISQGFASWWTCDNPLFSASLLTIIVDYVSGGRFGCNSEKTADNATAVSCSAEVSEEQVVAAANKVGEKYGIQGSWINAMWKLEGGSTQMGDACIEKNNFKVMGPFQITKGAYDSVTCDKERFATAEQEKAQCAQAGKLSRCSLEGSMELAARVLLGKLKAYGYYAGAIDCQATQAAVSGSQLFRAVNAYGACNLVNGTVPYAAWVCDVAGSCPSPLPPSGAPLSCAGN